MLKRVVYTGATVIYKVIRWAAFATSRAFENEGLLGLYVTAINTILFFVYAGVKLDFPC